MRAEKNPGKIVEELWKYLVNSAPQTSIDIDLLSILISIQLLIVIDPWEIFKGEWEALEMTEHNWALRNAEMSMMAIVEARADQ
jgi:hypothetical protein